MKFKALTSLFLVATLVVAVSTKPSPILARIDGVLLTYDDIMALLQGA